MNLLLVEPHETDAEGRVRLAGRRAEHLLEVLRVAPGQTLRAGVVGGGVGEATVAAIVGAEVAILLGPLTVPPTSPPLALAVGLPRPQGLHRVLQTVAAMGVDRLHLTNAWRVEKSYFSSPSLAPATIRRHLLLGAEQGMTPRLPEVEVHPRLLPFVAAEGGSGDGRLRLLAHPGAPPIEEVVTADAAGDVLVAIGPEGGWIDREVDTFVGAGFQPVSLGPWVLRVEVAVAAVLAQLALLRRRAVAAAPATEGGPRATLAAGTRPR